MLQVERDTGSLVSIKTVLTAGKDRQSSWVVQWSARGPHKPKVRVRIPAELPPRKLYKV